MSFVSINKLINFPIEFSKLTLATSKIVAIESVNEQNDRNIQAAQTVTRMTTTTTTTTMTKVLDEALAQTDADNNISCAQQPQQQQKQKILLYESSVRDETQSALLTDDDTDSVGSSLDSKDLESGLKEISQPTQSRHFTADTVVNVDQIDSQMQSLSFISTLDRRGVADAKSDDGVQNMSRQFDQLDIVHNQDEIYEHGEEQATENVDSIVSLSSNDTLDREPDNTKEKSDSDSVIVLSDSDTQEAKTPSVSPPKRNISQEPPLKPFMASSNDPAMYNISPIDSTAMQQVNNFFDNAPFVEPVEPIEIVENSFNSSHISRSVKEDIFVPETTDEESMAENSINGARVHGETDQTEKDKSTSKQQHSDSDSHNSPHQPDFSDNNIIVDIPVIKSTSDQPRQLIRSQSGVRLTASRSSPITKTTTDGIIRSSNVILKTPGKCGITVNSSNGQLSIAAKININIQIVEDSSEESSEDNRPARKSAAIQSSEDCTNGRNTNINSNDINSAELPASTRPHDSNPKNNRTPVKNSTADAGVNTTPRTPKTANKLKQFEFVPPKSMTKSKKKDSKQQAENENDAKPSTKSMTSESSENDGFQVDKNIPISPRDQKLLVRIVFFNCVIFCKKKMNFFFDISLK